MKNLLNYFYHIYPDKIFEKNNIFYFFLDENKYYFMKFNRNIEDLKILVELTNSLYEKKVKVHTFIKNINDGFFVSFGGSNYVLLRVNVIENDNLDLVDIIKFNQSMLVDKNVLFRNDWDVRWSEQVDRFELQITEYNKEYPLMLGCFDYYIGLAENAISYIKASKNETSEYLLCLSHRRIYFPLNYDVLYNPLNFMFDYKIRDVAEYIKFKFFYSNFDFEELENYIKDNKFVLTQNDIEMLYARLLYPTYYFDFFEKVINDEIKEEHFNKYIGLSSEYEEFLLEVNNYLKLKYNIMPVDWIANNK